MDEANNESSGFVDIDARASSAWAQVRAYIERLREGLATRDDDPQPALASEFFQSYLAQKQTTGGRKALETAFTMWGNTSSVDAIDAALPQLDPHADSWRDVLHGVGNAYGRSGRHEDYLQLVHHYETLLTHPKSRSAVCLILAEYYAQAGEPQRARKYYEQVVALGADPYAVRQSEDAVRELDFLAVGQRAPDFTAHSIDGQTIRLSDLRGRVVLLDFWSTTCGPCLVEIPHLKAIHAEHATADIYLLGISNDQSEADLRRFIEREGISWPQIREVVTWQSGVAELGPIGRLYNVYGIPRSFLIDRSGAIAAKDLRSARLVQAVRALGAHEQDINLPRADE